MNNNERWGVDAAEEADRAVAGGQAPRGLPQVAQITGPLCAELQCLAAAGAIGRQVRPSTSMNPWNGG